ncbi:MAG TPA: ABC transporter substrate-binding protein, partial [Gaiellaceae bacterium]|nr:ABC transporter substrate-binding protein [Gaiellaceae bacterium]
MPIALGVVVLLAAASIAAVVSGGAKADRSGVAVSGGTVTIDTSSPPNSLDPQSGYTVTAGESDWLAYVPLLTYAHKSGVAGTQLIPGLATALPKITNGSRTYTLTLRAGLKYSDGTPVVASDFKFAIERALKLNWGASSFLLPIAGASDYLAGKARTISGITTNDASRAIAIHLSTPVGNFSNVLAFPGASPVSQKTPMTNQVTSLPPGVGPYVIKNVVPNVSWSLVKNPLFASFHIPGIPTGTLDQINIHQVSNNLTEAEAVLNNQVDAFDVGDSVPPTLIAQIVAKAANRFAKEPVASTNYFFLNQRIPPFNNPLAREAAN